MTAPGKAPSPSQWAMERAREHLPTIAAAERVEHTARKARETLEDFARWLDAARAAGQREAIEAAVAAVEAEDELGGSPPAGALAFFATDPVAAMRAAVRVTKGNIAARIRSLPAAKGEVATQPTYNSAGVRIDTEGPNG